MPETDSHADPDAPGPDRLRSLLRANRAVVEQIDLPRVLQRAVEAATRLVDAEYGAMGVLTPEKDALEQFVYAGITDEQAEAIGHLPEGRGLLGALIDDPRPIRLRHMADDARAVGFPAHHPPMDTFLGVPIRIRGEVFGNFYLANHRGGGFTEEDEQLLSELAATVGIAIDNARLFADVGVRERWASAAAELASAIVSTPSDTVYDLLAGRLHDVAVADLAAVLLLDAQDRLRVAASRGDSDTLIPGSMLEPAPALVAAVLDDGRPHARARAREVDADPLLVAHGGFTGAALAVPLKSRVRMWGVMLVARGPDGSRFSAAEIASASDLASRASIALELGRAREDAQRALLADDRRRIARDLHDHVIQQLFGTGLSLQAVAARLGPGADNEALNDAIGQLDDAVHQIRTVVFALSHRDEASVRHRLLDVIGELSAHGHRPPAIRFTGPVDHLVRDGLATDVVAVARELLSNALRHAQADRVSIDVTTADGRVTVLVADDGEGIPRDAERRGLANLDERARARQGSFGVQTGSSGTTVTWSAPLGEPAPAREPEGVS